MLPFSDLIAARMTDDDRRQMADIFEPTEVAVPDADARWGLCVTRDGAIRFYGLYRRHTVFDTDCPRCYLESTDGGLSWKRHVVDNPEVLGAAAYIPFLDRYMTVRKAKEGGLEVRIGLSPDDPAPQNIPAGEPGFFEPGVPQVLRSRNRILITAHERRPALHPTAFFPVLLYSDDGGENWVSVHLAAAPFFSPTPPATGVRWQQNNREHTVAELSDGRLLMISRTATDYHYMATSDDGGTTWTDFTPTVFRSTGTMPRLYKLSDGKLLFLWCNTNLLPERPDADGIWEDYFTNRDACHAAISEDDGKTWEGYRELLLNPVRNAVDFRAFSDYELAADKSVHQSECLELPNGKLLIAVGQHSVSRRLLLVDRRWLYEKNRHESFTNGLRHLSTHLYIQSVPGGGYATSAADAELFVGHCAYNRVSGALLLPSPDGSTREALYIPRYESRLLVSGVAGAVWNFPLAKRGCVSFRAYLPGEGLRVSLLDHWRNPCDETVGENAECSFVLCRDLQPKGELFTVFSVDFDFNTATAVLRANGEPVAGCRLAGISPMGICYLHLQTAAAREDTLGSYLMELDFRGTDTAG